MPLDAVCLTGIVGELQEIITGLRIEKIQQPSRDQVILLLRGSKRLLLNAGSGQPRIQLTEIQRENPAAPPMFCMLLRKHIGSARLVEIQQLPMERCAVFTFDCIDEMGDAVQKKLIAEIVELLKDSGKES